MEPADSGQTADNFMTREQLNEYIRSPNAKIRLYHGNPPQMVDDLFLYRSGDDEEGIFYVYKWWCADESRHNLQTGDTIGIMAPERMDVQIKKLLL